MSAVILQETALKEIYELGLERSPAEACGLLLPRPWKNSWIREIPNRSMHSHDSFEFATSDIYLVLDGWLEYASPVDFEDMAIWHTHPGGGIGPSRLDLRGKLQGTRNLVVAITNEGPVPSWY